MISSEQINDELLDRWEDVRKGPTESYDQSLKEVKDLAALLRQAEEMESEADLRRKELEIEEYKAKTERMRIDADKKIARLQTGAKIVAIAHEKELSDDNNPDFNTIIPSLMTSSSVSLCAKASFVWYTKVEREDSVDVNNNVVSKTNFVTYISAHPYLVTKCRKPKDFKVPEKVTDLTYDKFKKNVLDKMMPNAK